MLPEDVRNLRTSVYMSKCCRLGSSAGLDEASISGVHDQGKSCLRITVRATKHLGCHPCTPRTCFRSPSKTCSAFFRLKTSSRNSRINATSAATCPKEKLCRVAFSSCHNLYMGQGGSAATWQGSHLGAVGLVLAQQSRQRLDEHARQGLPVRVRRGLVRLPLRPPAPHNRPAVKPPL